MSGTTGLPLYDGSRLESTISRRAVSTTTRSHIEITRMREPGLQSRPVTVLVVDDDPAVTETFGRMLTLEGYIVRSALSAEAGLHEADIGRLDAILLDLRMPLVDGLAFLRRLRAREQPRQTPVAIVTGDYFVDDTVSSDLRGLGAELYFKPLWLEDVVRLTHTLVDGAPPSPNS